MHQYLTFIGNFPIRFYGIFFSFGIIAGCIIAYFLLKKEGHGWEKILFDFGLVISFSGIIGGRLWDVFFFDWQYYHNHLLEIPFIWQGGMAIQGGLLFSAIAAYFFLKKTWYSNTSFCRYYIPRNYFRTSDRSHCQFYEWRCIWTSNRKFFWFVIS